LYRYVVNHPETSEGKVDLEKLLNQCESSQIERLSGLIYRRAVLNGQFDSLPSGSKFMLKSNTFKLIADVESKKNIVNQIATALQGSNLTVLLLKGMAFNDLIYSTDSPRGTSDIDLLLMKSEKEALTKQLAPIAKKVEVPKKYVFDNLFEEVWSTKSSNRVFLDMHWYLSYPNLYNFDQQQIFERSIPHPFYKSENLRLLSHEDHLVYLAIHLTKDCDFYNYGLIDCHELITQFQPNLKRCFEIARGWGAKRSLFYMLRYAKREMSTQIDESILMINSPSVFHKWLSELLIKYIFSKNSTKKTNFHRIKQMLCLALFCDNPRVAFRHYKLYFKLRFSLKGQ
jgi:hypothetical protein